MDRFHALSHCCALIMLHGPSVWPDLWMSPMHQLYCLHLSATDGNSWRNILTFLGSVLIRGWTSQEDSRWPAISSRVSCHNAPPPPGCVCSEKHTDTSHVWGRCLSLCGFRGIYNTCLKAFIALNKMSCQQVPARPLVRLCVCLTRN